MEANFEKIMAAARSFKKESRFLDTGPYDCIVGRTDGCVKLYHIKTKIITTVSQKEFLEDIDCAGLYMEDNSEDSCLQYWYKRFSQLGFYGISKHDHQTIDMLGRNLLRPIVLPKNQFFGFSFLKQVMTDKDSLYIEFDKKHDHFSLQYKGDGMDWTYVVRDAKSELCSFRKEPDGSLQFTPMYGRAKLIDSLRYNQLCRQAYVDGEIG